MEQEWLIDFYKECGRELSLASQVINQSNNWALTVITVIFVVGIFESMINKNGETITFTYQYFHWYLAAFSLIILIRFFVRSCIGFVNMIRWNILMKNINIFLSFQENHPKKRDLEEQCINAIDTYYLRWKSPVKKGKLIINNLKLMYLWLFIPILITYLYGLCYFLDFQSSVWWFGVLIFILPFITEIVWFCDYYAFEYEEIEPFCECKDIKKLWLEELK